MDLDFENYTYIYLYINGAPKAGAFGVRRLPHGGTGVFLCLQLALRAFLPVILGSLGIIFVAFSFTAHFWMPFNMLD